MIFQSEVASEIVDVENCSYKALVKNSTQIIVDECNERKGNYVN